jgi:hypothetical protein
MKQTRIYALRIHRKGDEDHAVWSPLDPWSNRFWGTLAEVAVNYQKWAPTLGFPNRWFVVHCRDAAGQTVQYPAEVLFGDG